MKKKVEDSFEDLLKTEVTNMKLNCTRCEDFGFIQGEAASIEDCPVCKVIKRETVTKRPTNKKKYKLKHTNLLDEQMKRLKRMKIPESPGSGD